MKDILILLCSYNFSFYTFYDPFSFSACTLCKFDKTGPCETKISNLKSHLSNEGECSFSKYMEQIIY